MDPLNVTIVFLLLVAVVLIEQADRMDLVSTQLFRLRIRLSRRMPAGRHIVAGDGSCGVGRPDTSMVFKVPLSQPGGMPPVKYVGVTDTSTHFTVNDEVVTLDEFLEAYDEGRGPIEVEVREVGRIAVMSIGGGGVASAETQTPD